MVDGRTPHIFTNKTENRLSYADWYRPLFELARRLYGEQIYAWYFDLPFEETLRRHRTKPNCNEFGAEAMKGWWRDKDFSDVLDEKVITAEAGPEDIVSEISVIIGRALDYGPL